MTPTKIEWTDETWGVVVGCDRVSTGCDACYAIGHSRRLSGNPNEKISAVYENIVRRTPNGLDWTGIVRALPERLEAPLHWTKPKRIFVANMADLFHAKVPKEFIAAVFGVMAVCPQHRFQLLTKRPSRMKLLLTLGEFRRMIGDEVEKRTGDRERADAIRNADPSAWPLPNVWLGTSVEANAHRERITYLRESPAVVHFVSAEPLIAPLSLRWWACPCGWEGWELDSFRCPRCRQNTPLRSRVPVDWVIVGGESGAGARPMHPDWARAIRDMCTREGSDTAFFFKQIGEFGWDPSVIKRKTCSLDLAVNVDGRSKQWDLVDRSEPGWAMTYRCGKYAAGRLLDGREWNEMPEVAA